MLGRRRATPRAPQALVDFLLSREVQAALPDAMYVFPVDAGAALPADWAQFAAQPDRPLRGRPGRDRRATATQWLPSGRDVISR